MFQKSVVADSHAFDHPDVRSNRVIHGTRGEACEILRHWAVSRARLICVLLVTSVATHCPISSVRTVGSAIVTGTGLPAGIESTSQAVESLRSLVDRAIWKLGGINPGETNELFRYFEESTDMNRVLRDKRLVRLWFVHFSRIVGTLGAFGELHEPSSPYVNLFVESAYSEVWRRSSCEFRTVSLGAELASGIKTRHVEIFLEVCLDRKVPRAWLKKVDIHIPRPDRDVVDRIAEFTRVFQQAIRQS
jgi:hypothetical protein